MSHTSGTESTATAFAVEVLHRLPLAEAFYTVWGYLASDAVLADLFDRHRGRCYEDQLTFAELVRVLADALTRYHGRGRGAILDAVERNQISCQVRAVYLKLSRLPLPLAEALLTTLTQRLRPLFPDAARPAALPASLDGLSVVVVDGKKIKRVAKRLLPTRNQPGKLYGGKLLVAYLPAEGVAVALAADVDGEANDIRSVPALLPTVRAAVTGPRLWVADRQFCDLIQPRRFADGGDHFVIRYGNNTGFHPDGARAAAEDADADGRAVRQEWGWLGAEKQGERRLYVRRVCPPKRTNRFTRDMVLRLTAHLGLARRQRYGSSAGLGRDEYRPMSLARRLGISRDTVRRWLRAGWLNLRRDEDGHHVIWADAGELRRLRELHDLPRTWANKTRLAKLKKPKPRPAR